MDKSNYEKAKLKLALIIFGIIYIIIQVYSIFFVTFRFQAVKRFEDIPTPPQAVLERAIEQRNQAIQEAITAQISLSLIGAIISYYLAEFALKPIKQNMKDQKDFLMFASHELRTPITNLMLLTEDEKDEKFLSINEELERLRNSTQKYLELLTKENNQVQITKERVNLHSIMEDVLLNFKHTIDYEKIIILNQIPNDLEIFSDKHSLFSVFRNIIENSIKNIGEDKKITFKSISELDDTRVEIQNSYQKKQSGFGIGTKIINFYESILNFEYKFRIENQIATSTLIFENKMI